MYQKDIDNWLFKKIKNETGSALVLTLVIAGVIVMLSAAQLLFIVVEAKQIEKSFLSDQAFNIAEAGAEEAIWEVNYGGADFLAEDGWAGTKPVVKTANVTDLNQRVIGFYTISIADPSANEPIVGAQATSFYQSNVGAETRAVEVGLRKMTPSDYTMAAFAETSIDVRSNAGTDSFDSRLGPYDATTNSGNLGDIGTNSTAAAAITTHSNSDVDGDAYVGLGGDPAIAISQPSSSDFITGDEKALDAVKEIPSIIGPVGLTDRGSLYVKNDVVIDASGQYADITFKSNSTLTIDGDVTLYVTGTLGTASNTEIIITEGSEVEIYVDGQIYLRSNSTINNETMDPTKLKIFGTDSLVNDGTDPGIRFHSNTDIYAVVQAKNSDVSLNSNAEVYGAIIADNIVLHSNSYVHYDVALQGGGGSSGVDYEVIYWQER